jgi:predicted ABC-type ATPase
MHHKYTIMKYNQMQPTILKEGVWDLNIFKAVFMAGAPGSGKSTVQTHLFGQTNLKVVNIDLVRRQIRDIQDLQNKKQALKSLEENAPVEDYKKYGELAKAMSTNYMKQRLGLLMDTTSWWFPSVKDTTLQLRELGYDVGMVHVFVPLQQSLERAKTRAQTPGVDYGRVVDEQEIIMRYEEIKHNVRDLIELFGDNYWFIENSGTTERLINKCDILKKTEINSWLNQPPESPTAIDWIHKELLRDRPSL